MSDNEIKKALECCKDKTRLSCKYCPLHSAEHDCIYAPILSENVLDLINRQQAEIERLQSSFNAQAEVERLESEYPCKVKCGNNCEIWAKSLSDYDNLIDDISAEGIKEFWKKFDEVLCQNIGPSRRLYWRILEAGNNLVAEMTESPTKIEHSSLCETDTYEVKE